MYKNLLRDWKNLFSRPVKHLPITDPQLEAVFQQALAQIPPEKLLTSRGQLRGFFLMGREAGKQEGKKEVYIQSPTLLCPVCNEMVMALYPTEVPHQFIQRCDACEKRSQEQQNEKQTPNPYKLHIDYMQQKRAAQEVVRAREERLLRKTILTDVPTARNLPPVPPEAYEVAHQNGERQAPHIEEVSWLNGTPVTPGEVPAIDEQEGKTETGLPALVAHLKHVGKRV